MKDIMVSIAPKWCARIAAGEKLGEVRKSVPKVKPPFKCLVYCTLPPRDGLFMHGRIVEYANELIRLQSGEIVYSYGMQLACDPRPYTADNFLCKKVIGEFICDFVETTNCFAGGECPERESVRRRFSERSCVTEDELERYAGGKTVYLWNISQFNAYDKPKTLEAFCLARPPQSWCYIKEEAGHG